MRDHLTEKLFERRGALRKAADVCGVSKQAVSGWQRVPVRHVRAISETFGVPISDFRPDLAELFKGTQTNGAQETL